MMDQTLGYLREILSNYTDQYPVSKTIFHKLKNFESEESFVWDITDEESDFLDKILPEEINHAKEEQDFERAGQLNEVYELLI